MRGGGGRGGEVRGGEGRGREGSLLRHSSLPLTHAACVVEGGADADALAPDTEGRVDSTKVTLTLCRRTAQQSSLL